MGRCLRLRRIRRFFYALVFTVFLYLLMKIPKLLRNSGTFLIFTNYSFGQPKEYLLNTSGCKIPKLDPFHASIKHFIKRLDDLNCTNPDFPSFVYVENNTIRLYSDVSDLQVNCTAKTIASVNDFENEEKDERIISLNGATITSEFTHVECAMENELNMNFNTFYPVVMRKKNVEARIQAYLQSKSKSDNQKLTVILLGLDSVSKNQFLRHMVKTLAFMKSKLEYIELHGYNKIGQNTYSNIVPMFTGSLMSEVPDTSEVPVDVLPLIWKDFMENGYRTQYSEDYPPGAIFNYARKGFNQTPVDYYLRPFSLAVEPHIDSWETGCLNDRTEAGVIFQWMQDFLDFFPGDPLFTFTFLTRLSHDYLNFLSYLDAPVLNFFKHLYHRGHFNNSVMFFFGDHGFRFGEFRSTYMGRMEGRLPFMFIIIPPWFPNRYPQLYENLKVNENRLTTSLDIYATLKDLVQFNGEGYPKESVGRSISLMKHQVPKSRTCENAGILSQWCSCYHREPVLLNHTDVILSATNIVNQINAITSHKRKQCAVFSLTKVLNASARLIGMGEDSSHDGFTNYLLTFQVSPSNGIFEGSIWFDGKSKYTVEDTIERVNLYGNQSACVDVNDLKPFCYCITDH